MFSFHRFYIGARKIQFEGAFGKGEIDIKIKQFLILNVVQMSLF